jgi:hypothetical protein
MYICAWSSCRLIQQLKILQVTLPDSDLVLKVDPSVFLVVCSVGG